MPGNLCLAILCLAILCLAVKDWSNSHTAWQGPAGVGAECCVGAFGAVLVQPHAEQPGFEPRKCHSHCKLKINLKISGYFNNVN